MSTIEKLENNRAKLTISVSPEAFGAAVQKAYQKTASRYNVPGFRKGKAPRKVIENMYGESAFYEEAFDLVWGDAYDAALAEHKLTAVDKPSLDITAIGLDGVVFTAEVQLKPEVTLGAYQKLEVPEPDFAVKDEEVLAEIEKEREKSARFVEVDRAVENGDRVILDYSGSVNGEKFDGGTAEDQLLVIGSGSFIPGFEEQLVGLKAGEEKDISVRFPDEYSAPLAGKDAVFAIKIKAVQVKELPELDDEFAKDISDFDTLDALKADKKAKMEEKAEQNRKTAIENIALQKAADNAIVDIPDVMIERQINYMLRDIAYQLSRSGLSLEDYVKYTGTDMNGLKESYRAEATARVKMQLVIEAIGEKEGVTCTEEDMKALIAEYAEGSGKSAEEFESTLKDDDREYLSDNVLARKAVKIVTDSAVLVKDDAAKKPAKKASAKKTEAKAEDAAEAEKPAKKAAKKAEPKE
ncbi:MAG TPA: trigger factor [Clostridiales bacterium]|jgi:trigger factor|nr:trigger factor [Clostridiales bacterium]